MNMLKSERFGRGNIGFAPMFKEDGEYTLKVADRLRTASNPVVVAEQLARTLSVHGDREHNLQAESILNVLDDALAKFKTDYVAAATPEAKEAAVKEFSTKYAITQANMLQSMSMAFMLFQEYKPKAPNSFASAVADVLFDSFDALKNSLSGSDQVQLMKDASNIAYKELGLGYGASFLPWKVVDALIADTQNLGGDKDYQVDIGV